jgi:hypothetical protein
MFDHLKERLDRLEKTLETIMEHLGRDKPVTSVSGACNFPPHAIHDPFVYLTQLYFPPTR